MVSRRRPFEHVPAKADLLSSGHEQYTDRLRHHLAHPGPGGGDLADLVTSA